VSVRQRTGSGGGKVGLSVDRFVGEVRLPETFASILT